MSEEVLERVKVDATGADGLHEALMVDGAPLVHGSFPGARDPDRVREVTSSGVRLAVYEWGDGSAEPLILVHGGFDFAHTFDVFAPLLADAGYRVVSWDHRGHGSSEHTELYSWGADERDMLAVVDSVTREPCLAVGHSKGGSMLVHAIQALPHRFTRFVAIDGLPFRGPAPDVAERDRTALMRGETTRWLDHRRRAAGLVRKPGSIEDLALRRGRMNPRLSHQWLCYLVTRGARQDEDGWRWRIDPALRMGGFGPHRARWALDRLPGFPIPMLALFGTEKEPMGWGVKPGDIEPYLPPTGETHLFDGIGHFIHIERPKETAEVVLEFLAR